MALTSTYIGVHGSLGLAVAGSPEQQADFKAISDAYTSAIVGRVTEVEVCVRTDLEEFFEIGQRDITTIAPGNIRITGSIGRAYINGALLFLLLGRGAVGGAGSTIQPKFVLNIELRNPHVPQNSLKVNVFGVKFESWSFSLPQETFVMEKVRFKAERMGLIDTEAGKDIAVAFPQQR